MENHEPLMENHDRLILWVMTHADDDALNNILCNLIIAFYLYNHASAFKFSTRA